MIISVDSKQGNRIVVFNDDEWNNLMLHKESCFKQMFDEDSNFEMSQDEFVLLDNIK